MCSRANVSPDSRLIHSFVHSFIFSILTCPKCRIPCRSTISILCLTLIVPTLGKVGICISPFQLVSYSECVHASGRRLQRHIHTFVYLIRGVTLHPIPPQQLHIVYSNNNSVPFSSFWNGISQLHYAEGLKCSSQIAQRRNFKRLFTGECSASRGHPSAKLLPPILLIWLLFVIIYITSFQRSFGGEGAVTSFFTFFLRIFRCWISGLLDRSMR